jgi:hypothetical protein
LLAPLVISIAISGAISLMAGLLSSGLIVVMFIIIARDVSTSGTSYSSVIGAILLGHILNKFTKITLPFPANLIYVLLLFLVAYSAWRSWASYKDNN